METEAQQATANSLEQTFATTVARRAMKGRDVLNHTNAEAAAFMNMTALLSKEAGKLIGAAKDLFAHSQAPDISTIEDALADIEFAAQAIRQQFGLPRERILCHQLNKLGVEVTAAMLGHGDEETEDTQGA